MDINSIINRTVTKILADEAFKERFFDDPVTALEETADVHLPNEDIDPIVEGVKAKLNLKKKTNMPYNM